MYTTRYESVDTLSNAFVMLVEYARDACPGWMVYLCEKVRIGRKRANRRNDNFDATRVEAKISDQLGGKESRGTLVTLYI